MMPTDKQLHLYIGAAVSALLVPHIGLWAVVVTATLGAAKEAWDYTGRGHLDFADFAATAAGGALSVAASAGLNVFFR